MKNPIVAFLLLVLFTPVALLAETDFPNNYREASTILDRMNCAGVILTRYESSNYKLIEYNLPNNDIILLFTLANSNRKTYLKKGESAEFIPVSFDRAKTLYEQALNLPVPDAIPICTNLPKQ